MSKTFTGNDCVYSDEIKEKLQKFSLVLTMILAAHHKSFLIISKNYAINKQKTEKLEEMSGN